MQKILIALVILLCLYSNSFSQFLSGKDAQVLVKGIIVEENSGEPLAVGFELRTNDGKKIKSVTNADGKFEQLLPSGQTYLVILTGDDILRKEFNFTVETTDKYKEQKTEWTAIKPTIGSKVFAGNIFKNGTDELSESGEASLKEIQMLLRFNRSLYVDFEISNSGNLTTKRIDFINKTIESWTREKSRIVVKQSQRDSGNKDFFVHITKLSDFLNK